ncbi:hypothetical protein Ate01nite_62850 [Actinoplanes teichomyceticus]|nr:hypothetical protein Ate01nite_62850 [Actinoplanes teichomyceticus]
MSKKFDTAKVAIFDLVYKKFDTRDRRPAGGSPRRLPAGGGPRVVDLEGAHCAIPARRPWWPVGSGGGGRVDGVNPG